MKKIFTDSINWVVYLIDDEGKLCIKDYPKSDMHGGGPPRIREINNSEYPTDELVQFLKILNKHSDELHEHYDLTKIHLHSIYKIFVAQATNQGVYEVLENAIRTFGWSFLPGKWGSEIEKAWSELVKDLKSINRK